MSALGSRCSLRFGVGAACRQWGSDPPALWAQPCHRTKCVVPGSVHPAYPPPWFSCVAWSNDRWRPWAAPCVLRLPPSFGQFPCHLWPGHSLPPALPHSSIPGPSLPPRLMLCVFFPSLAHLMLGHTLFSGPWLSHSSCRSAIRIGPPKVSRRRALPSPSTARDCSVSQK